MLSRLKSVFSLFQHINVRKSPVPLNNVSSVITERETAIQEPVIGPIRAPATEFLFEGCSGGQCGPPIGHHPINVFGMYCISPPPTNPLFSGEPRVVQPTSAYEVDRPARPRG